MSRVPPSPEWSDNVEWWLDPGLAYTHGLQDGFKLGLQRYDEDLAAALIATLGGGASRAEAIEAAQRAADQHHNREAWYRSARLKPPEAPDE